MPVNWPDARCGQVSSLPKMHARSGGAGPAQGRDLFGHVRRAGKQYETTLEEAQWRTLTLGATYRLGLGLLGGVREVTPI
jgi:hypothetical protein